MVRTKGLKYELRYPSVVNMKKTLLAIFFISLFISCASTKPAAKKPEAKVIPPEQLKPQETCPYKGTPIDPFKYVEYKGQKIYVCCQPCLKLVEKNPQKAIDRLKSLYGEKLQEISN